MSTSHENSILVKAVMTCFVVAFASFVMAQPELCDPDNPQMTPTCLDCCIVCDIDGFTGRHSGFEDGEDPPGFAGECTMVAHNMRWIAFVAGSVDLKVSLAVSNCALGYGLEFGLYKGDDCTNYQRISNCYGGMNSIPPGSSGVIENNEPLVIGQYYYIVMDGALEDNCDWTFNVLEGSTVLLPLEETMPIEGPDVICPLSLQSYETAAMEGATLFYWTLDQTPIGNNTNNAVDLLLPAPGFYSLCVTAANPCDIANTTCRQIEVRYVPDTFITDEFCEGDCYESGTNTYCETGIYDYTISLENGCDSTIILDLTELPQPENFLDLNICDGESIEIDGMVYSETGVYDQLVQVPGRCDSLVHLDLFVVICVIQSESVATPPNCYGGSDGTIDFQVTQGTPPFTYNWTHLNSGFQNTGSINSLNEMIQIDALQAGTYVIEIQDNFGDFDIIVEELVAPEAIDILLNLSDYNGYEVSCHEGTDGFLEAIVSGGIEPYVYQWSNNASTAAISNLEAGSYTLSLTDFVGCEKQMTYVLNEPDALVLEVEYIDPSCDDLESGQIEILLNSGGVGPYVFDLNGSGFSENPMNSNLPEGNYTVTMMDENNCEIKSDGMLVAPEIPILSGVNNYVLNLGDSLDFEITLNEINVAEISWSPETNLSCADCLEPTVKPIDDTNYKLTIVSNDGCEATLDIFVRVEKSRAFYPPNIFSPNGDGVNDYFNLNGSAEVESYRLSVVDRWGNIIYKADVDSNMNDEQGWDGRTNSGYVNPGVFVWLAEITFIDGVSISYTGNVTVVR